MPSDLKPCPNPKCKNANVFFCEDDGAVVCWGCGLVTNVAANRGGDSAGVYNALPRALTDEQIEAGLREIDCRHLGNDLLRGLAGDHVSAFRRGVYGDQGDD